MEGGIPSNDGRVREEGISLPVKLQTALLIS